MPEPLVSIVMPVFNALPFLQQSIESIVNQSLADIEFVILNDASTDGSDEVLREWEQKDARIRVHHSDRRLGLSMSSNLVISKARAQLIARMDADDVSDKDRLKRQFEVMRNNDDVVLVGTLNDGIDQNGRHVRGRDRWRILRHSLFPPFPHGSVMFRRSAFEAIGGYGPDTVGYEDQDLFLRLAQRGRVVTLPEVLYHYRYHLQSSTISSVSAAEQYTLDHWHSLGAMRFWAGHRPDIVRAVMRETSESWSLRRLMVLLWASWAELNPASLRFISRSAVQVRDLLASLRVVDGRLYEWRFK
jgi:glycosyltransferase involved in cell wall biosynthesis